VRRQIALLGVVILICYVALFVRFNQIQVFQADALNERTDNTRQLQRDFNEPRGSIITADGALAAYSEERRATLRYQRIYPEADLLSAVTGFYSFNLGSSGVERSYNDELAGRTTALKLRELTGFFSDVSSEGDVILTVRKDLQQVARDSLGDRQGAVVAIDPRDGSILSMWSWPPFDPNQLSTNDSTAAEAAKRFLDAVPQKPLLIRAYQDNYFPGSTFKIVTAAAGLENRTVTTAAPDYPVVTSYTPPLTTSAISNFGGSSCGGTLIVITARSCNSSFAQMAIEQTGPEPMIAAAERVGFNDIPPIDLPDAVTSIYPVDFGDVVERPPGLAPVYSDAPRLAQTAIGQNDVRATPLQMALVAAGVANDGDVLAPHVMAEIRARDGSVVERYEPQVWRQAFSPTDAATLRQAMIGVVTDGTAQNMAIPGFEVGAKTGTAQLGTTPPRSHGWMIAFGGRPGEVPTVAVAVIVENLPGASSETGGSTAGPVARAVLSAALGAG